MPVTERARACAVPPDVWARRMEMIGAPAELWAITPGEGLEPWQPWASPVMTFAAILGDEVNLWLSCCECGWGLGYSGTCSPGYLAEQAALHRAMYCDESAEHNRTFYSEGQGAMVTAYRLAADNTWQERQAR